MEDEYHVKVKMNAEPFAIDQNYDTGVDHIKKLIRGHFPLKPKAMINALDLLRPIYRKTACHGHFGRNEPEFTWEKTDKAEILQKEAGL